MCFFFLLIFTHFMKESFSQMKKRERMFWRGKERWSKKWNSSKALLLTNTDALKRSCSAWILIQSINKWIMQLVDIQLTGFTTHVELTGSACICMSVTCPNEYAIKGHAVERWLRFVWGRESCLPTAKCATDKALVWVGRRNKSSTMQDPNGTVSVVAALFSPDEFGQRSINPKSFWAEKMSNWIWIEIYQSITSQKLFWQHKMKASYLAQHSHSLGRALLTDPNAKSIKTPSPVISNSSWKM